MTSDENKGEWAETAEEGIVPDALGEDRHDDKEPELPRAVTGRAADDSPATSTGPDLAAGDDADATRDGGPKETGDLRDAGAAPRAVDRESGHVVWSRTHPRGAFATHMRSAS
jgi:hypothetical protein